MKKHFERAAIFLIALLLFMALSMILDGRPAEIIGVAIIISANLLRK